MNLDDPPLGRDPSGSRASGSGSHTSLGPDYMLQREPTADSFRFTHPPRAHVSPQGSRVSTHDDDIMPLLQRISSRLDALESASQARSSRLGRSASIASRRPTDAERAAILERRRREDDERRAQRMREDALLDGLYDDARHMPPPVHATQHPLPHRRAASPRRRSSSPSGRHFSLRTTDIPKFSGAPTASVDEWIATVTTLLDQSGAPDTEVTSRLPMVLTGTALAWLNSLGPDERHGLRSWHMWTTRLRSAFRPADYDLVLRTKARDRLLADDESISAYYYDKLRLLRAAFPAASDAEHAHDLLLGLPTKFRLVCGASTHMPLDDLHRLLVDKSALLATMGWSDADPRHPPRARRPPRNNPAPATTEHPLPPKPMHPTGNKPDLTTDKPKRPPARPCRHCDQWHWDSDCPTRKNNPNPASTSNTVPLGPRKTNVTAAVAEALEASAAPPSTHSKSINASSGTLITTPCYTTVSVVGHDGLHRAIIDLGAGVSLIAKSYIDRHFPSATVTPCSSFPIQGIGSTSSFGFVSLCVAFGTPDAAASAPTTVPIDFYVTLAAPQGLLIGNDALVPLGATVDLATSTATIRGRPFAVSCVAPADRAPLSAPHARAVRVREAFIVRANHRARVAVTTDADPDGDTFLIEPTVIHGQDFPVRAARTLVDSQNSHLEVINLHHQPVHLRPGDVVGHTFPATLTPGAATQTAFVATTALHQTDFITSMDINPSLTATQRQQVVDMLHRRASTFSHNGSVGKTHLTTFRVDTGDALPIGQAPYHASPRQRAAIDESIDTMLAAGQIRPASSPWSSPVLVVYQHGKARVCVDYRKLNAVTRSDQYPLPRIDDILSQFQGKTWFTTLDANRGYHQVPVDKNDSDKLAFRTHRGLHAPLVMPFGAKGAPATFQRLMDVVLAAAKWQWALAYLDDVIVFSNTFDDHIRHVDWTLAQLGNAGLTIGTAKSHLFHHSLDALGHNISTLGIGMAPKNTEAITKQPPPTTLAALERFLGLTGYYRRFIKDYATVSRPLVDAIVASRKSKHLVFDDAAHKAFVFLRDAVATAPLLAHPDYTKPYILDTDASRDGMGAVLSQRDAENVTRPIAFISRTTTPAEKKSYSATELECTAMVWALSKFHPYVDGARVELVTDHAALQFLLDYKGDNLRLLRQCLTLQQYRPYLQIRHRPGKKHTHVDQLSREPVGPPEDSPSAFLAWRSPEDPALLAKVRKALPEHAKYGPLLDACLSTRDGKHPHLPFLVNDGLLYFQRPALSAYALCIPDDELRDTLLHDHHDAALSGHHGADKTYLSLARFYHWPNMRRSVDAYVRSCESCQKNKPVNMLPVGKLQPMPTPTTRWHTVTMDFAVQLPKSKGFDAVLVIVDKLSKRCHLVPTHTNATAADTAILFLWHVVRLHGMPTCIVSDRDAKFTSSFWRTLTASMGTKLLMSTAFHPETDGQSERQVRTLKEALRHFLNTRQDNWCDVLPALELAHNNSVHASTGLTPFELDLGFHPRLLGHQQPQHHDDADALTFAEHLHAAVVDATDSLAIAQGQQASHYDSRHRLTSFAVGDLVLLSTKAFRPAFLKARKSRKLSPTFFGPFPVTRVLGPTVVELDLPHTLHIHPRVNTQHCRKFSHRTPHTTAVREVDSVIGYRETFKTTAFPNGKPQWLVRFKGAVDGAEQWLDRAELNFYGVGDLLDAHDNLDVDPVASDAGETPASPGGGSGVALSPSTILHVIPVQSPGLYPVPLHSHR